MTTEYKATCLDCGETLVGLDNLNNHSCFNYDNQVYKQAIEKFGESNQCLKAVEEMSELIQILIKLRFNYFELDRKSIFSEIADVEIMLEQLKLIFDCHDIINTVKKQKIERLKGLVENG